MFHQAVHFLIARSIPEAQSIAERHGWTRIAAARFVTPDKEDIRVVLLPRDLNGQMPPDTTKVYFDTDYATSPVARDQESFKDYQRYADEFNYVMTELREVPDEAA